MMPPVTTLRALQYAAREIATPFSLALPDGSRLLCTDVLRLLPEKRIVLRATLGEKTVLAKLFFDAANWQKEITQYALLENTGVKTPELLTQYTLEQGGVCLYSFIDQAQPLDLLWQQADEEKKKRYLDLLLPCLQTLWQQKILQQDLHLGNFLLQGNDTLWMLDPASCKHYTHASEQQNNCALFLAQLPLSDWSFVAQHCQFDDAIQTLAAKQWQLRLKNYHDIFYRQLQQQAIFKHLGFLNVQEDNIKLCEVEKDELKHFKQHLTGNIQKNKCSQKLSWQNTLTLTKKFMTGKS